MSKLQRYELSLLNKCKTLTKDTIFAGLIKSQLVLCILIAVFTMLGNSKIVSTLFSITFVILIINFALILSNRKLQRSSLNDLIILLIIIILAFLSVLLVTDTASFDYLKKYIMFCCTLIFLFIVSRVVVDRGLVTFILMANFVLFIAYLLFFAFGGAPYYGGGLTMNFTNPNLLALWLLHTFLYLAVAMSYSDSRLSKVIFIIAIAITFVMIWETRTRSVLLSLSVFTILAALIIINRKFKFGKILSGFLILYPLLFAAAYTSLIDYPSIINLLDFMASPGKSLDNRLSVWNDAFFVIRNNPFFGNYSLISGGTGMSQMFNIHIDVLASYGCVVFFAFIIYLYRIIIRISAVSDNKLQKMSLACFFSVIVAGAGEAAFVSGSVGMYLLSCSFLLIARYKDPATDNTKRLK